MMRVLNRVIQLYLLITELIAERHRQRLRQKPHLRANPNVYQSQLDALSRLVRDNDKTCHANLRGETISRHFNAVLIAVIRLHNVLWYHPQLIPANEPDARWKWFENCLGAFDGTFVPVLPPAEHKARYRSRKGDYATNVLGVYSRNLQFVYALSSWEGSATDSRVLQNALLRLHGLRIPQGRYYLVDAGYTNGPGY
ncbi:hypothetical protein RHMOL_Rhmol09G0211900 [Rhododendron molle]|uniref:Uncharacterized protein n=1 Tax=Rhododendron molle TaxID=49168 RepID=A0ACC0MGW5_RHOML|nr:hypothetical protein RHMOL_Rhmol09G0211900 [Rhododendron molle]